MSSFLRPALPVSCGALALLACATLACATRAPSYRPVADQPPPNSLTLILENREALGLTPEQVSRITELDQELARQREPLLAELRSLRPGAPADGGVPMDGGTPPPAGTELEPSTPQPGELGPPGAGPGRRPGPGGRRLGPEEKQRMERTRYLVEELESLDILFYRDVEPLLDEAQRRKARELIRQRNEERRRERAPVLPPPPIPT